jgi:hypothetical protein
MQDNGMMRLRHGILPAAIPVDQTQQSISSLSAGYHQGIIISSITNTLMFIYTCPTRKGRHLSSA